MVVYTPQSFTFTGASLSGSSGATSRTYIVVDSNYVTSTFKVFVSGLLLHPSTDYTLSGTTLTFVNAIWDNQPILITYDLSSSAAAASTATYASTQDLAQYMYIEGVIPGRAVGQSRVEETVRAEDATNTRMWFDNAYIIAGAYTLYYGRDTDDLNALTETTHYIIDKDQGEINLTTAGDTLAGKSAVMAAYSHVKIGVTDTQLQSSLNKAQKEVDQSTNNHFADGTAATPDYVTVSNEKQTGKGQFNRDYFTDNRPVPNVITAISADLAAGEPNATVTSTNGFPSSGVIGIGTDKITYTGKTTTAFTGLSGQTGSYTSTKAVYPYIIERSVTREGATPTWDILENNKDYDIVLDTGKVYIYRSAINLQTDSIYYDTAPQFLVPNRFRTTYIYGNTTIPEDVKRVTLMIASKDIMHGAVRKSHSEGQNDFNPDLIDDDQLWIDKTLDRYRNFRSTNI